MQECNCYSMILTPTRQAASWRQRGYGLLPNDPESIHMTCVARRMWAGELACWPESRLQCAIKVLFPSVVDPFSKGDRSAWSVGLEI